jgi:hypothetical protein
LAPVWALDVRSASTGPSACTPMRSLKFIIFKAIIVTDTPPQKDYSPTVFLCPIGDNKYIVSLKFAMAYGKSGRVLLSL